MWSLRTIEPHDATPARLAEIRLTVEQAFGGDFTADDWAHALGGRHVVVEEGVGVLSHAAVVPRVIEVAGRPFRTGYVEAVATLPERRNRGLASEVMEEVGRIIRRDFEMGVLSSGLHRFYGRFGWEVWRGPTYVRSGAEVVRSEDDDGGIMVLRFGASAGVDLGAPISCEARSGDAW